MGLPGTIEPCFAVPRPHLHRLTLPTSPSAAGHVSPPSRLLAGSHEFQRHVSRKDFGAFQSRSAGSFSPLAILPSCVSGTKVREGAGQCLCVPRAKAIGLFRTVPPLGSPRSSGSHVATSVPAGRLVARLSKRRSPPCCSTSAVFPCTAAPSSCAFRPGPSSTGSGPVPRSTRSSQRPRGASSSWHWMQWGTTSRKSAANAGCGKPSIRRRARYGTGRVDGGLKHLCRRGSIGEPRGTSKWPKYTVQLTGRPLRRSSLKASACRVKRRPILLSAILAVSGIGAGVANRSRSLSRSQRRWGISREHSSQSFGSMGTRMHFDHSLIETLHFCNPTLNRMLPMCNTDMTPPIPENPHNHKHTAHGRQRWCHEALHA